MTGTPTWLSWQAMQQRCHNPNAGNYHKYGARGITVCDEWRESFEAFLSDMGPRPLGTTLDRRKNHLGYFKDNCRWATAVEQNRNRTFRSKERT
jgi:hypothetical protein